MTPAEVASRFGVPAPSPGEMVGAVHSYALLDMYQTWIVKVRIPKSRLASWLASAHFPYSGSAEELVVAERVQLGRGHDLHLGWWDPHRPANGWGYVHQHCFPQAGVDPQYARTICDDLYLTVDLDEADVAVLYVLMSEE